MNTDQSQHDDVNDATSDATTQAGEDQIQAEAWARVYSPHIRRGLNDLTET